ncbi:MAG: hypothetical protein LBC21_04190 [Oscillospiraceae bacterium]|jgi:hypothetical protein|nr:hypothetical protein [Oscillospiraceae bacterium]
MANNVMVQHLFKLNGFYKAPDGKMYKVVVSDVFNIRLFEIVGGNMVGPMIKIRYDDDFAKSLVEVE